MPAASSSTSPPSNGYRSVFREGLFAGKVIIVTGAGSGLGRCTAHELASLGATLALVGRSADKLKAVQAELDEDHQRASAGQKRQVVSFPGQTSPKPQALVVPSTVR